MKLRVEIDMDNAAFFAPVSGEQQAGSEAARILRWFAGMLEEAPTLYNGQACALRDVNGNRVGKAEVVE